MGYNLKPLDLQGAIGLEQLIKLDEMEAKRRSAKARLTKIFTDNIPNLRAPSKLESADPCWFGTPFICDEDGLKHRLVAFLEENKIQTRNYFAGNILLHPAYSHLEHWSNYPNANGVLEKVFFIGCSPTITSDNIEYIKEVISKYEN